MNIADVVNSASNSINKRSAASDRVITFCHRLDFRELDSVMKHFGIVIEKHG